MYHLLLADWNENGNDLINMIFTSNKNEWNLFIGDITLADGLLQFVYSIDKSFLYQ